MTDDTPKIAEKVKFWEEQDRINKELIPRIIKLHELFTSHIENHDSASSYIAQLEARIAEYERRLGSVRLQALGVAGISLVIALVTIVISVVS